MAADAQLILEALNAGLANYVWLNRETNSFVRTKVYFRLPPERDVHLDAPKTPSVLHLTAMQGFSVQIHLRRVVSQGGRRVDPARESTYLHGAPVARPVKGKSPEASIFALWFVEEGPLVLDVIYGSQVYGVEGDLWKLPPPLSRLPVRTRQVGGT